MAPQASECTATRVLERGVEAPATRPLFERQPLLPRDVAREVGHLLVVFIGLPMFAPIVGLTLTCAGLPGRASPRARAVRNLPLHGVLQGQGRLGRVLVFVEHAL